MNPPHPALGAVGRLPADQAEALRERVWSRFKIGEAMLPLPIAIWWARLGMFVALAAEAQHDPPIDTAHLDFLVAQLLDERDSCAQRGLNELADFMADLLGWAVDERASRAEIG